MKTAIEQYIGAKREHSDCKQWAEMLFKPYSGGGGGFGEIRSICIPTGNEAPTIYYQEYDGATNYHSMPASFKPHLEAAIKANFGKLLNEAFALQELALQKVATEAAREYQKLMQEANLIQGE